MPSKYATTSNVRYDENMYYDFTLCVIESDDLLSLSMIALLMVVLVSYFVYDRDTYNNVL